MDFKKRMEEIIDKGVSGTKDLWDKAKEKAKDLSQKGILTFEVSQLEHQTHRELARMGALVYEALVSRKEPAVQADNPEMKKILETVQGLKARIEAKEEELQKLKDKGS